MKDSFAKKSALTLWVLLLAALAFFSCSNLQGDAQSQEASGGQTTSDGQILSTSWEGSQTLSGSFGAQGIFPKEFLQKSSAPADATGGVLKTLFPSDPTASVTYSVNAVVHGGTETASGTVDADKMEYAIELSYAAGGTDWDVTVFGTLAGKTVLSKTQTINVSSGGAVKKPFTLEYSQDPLDGKGSIEFALSYEDDVDVGGIKVFCSKFGETDSTETDISLTSKTFSKGSLDPGAYDIKIVFFDSDDKPIYAIVEKANVYSNLITSVFVGKAPYIKTGGVVQISSGDLVSAQTVADTGIWLGGKGLVDNSIADDANDGTIYAPVASLRRAFEIAKGLAAADSSKTYTINVQGNVTIGAETEGQDDATLDSDTKVLVVGTNPIAYWAVDGQGQVDYITSSSQDSTFKNLAFCFSSGITVAAGKLTMDNCIVASSLTGDDDTGGGITVKEGASLESAQGLVIEDCETTVSCGGGIWCAGTIDLTDATVRGCKASSSTTGKGNGGGIYVKGANAVVKLDSCLIGKNSIQDSGASESSNSNYAQNYGGGIYIDSAKTVTLTNTSVSYNCASSGGGVYVANNTIKLVNSSIKNNGAIGKGAASGEGGGIYLKQGTLSSSDADTSISCNRAVGSSSCGGGLYISSSSTQTAAIKGTFDKNSCAASDGTIAGSGGAIYNACSNQLTLPAGATIGQSGKGNSAKLGGGVYNSGTLLVSGGAISGNTASEYGGGIYNTASHSVTIMAGTVSYNSAESGGGVYNYGTLKLDALACLSENAASSEYPNGGGAVYNKGSFSIGGSITIPYGKTASNDIYFPSNDNIIELSSALDGDFTGRITPNISFESSFVAGVPLISSSSVSGESLLACAKKFAITQSTKYQVGWSVSGSNANAIKDSEYVKSNYCHRTFSENFDGSQVFIKDREVAILNMLAGVHELTQGEFQRYCYYAHSGKQPVARYGVGDNYPAYYVSWYDMIVYCNLRSLAEGLTPAYSLDGETNPSKWPDILEDGGKYCGPYANNAKWNAIRCAKMDEDNPCCGWRIPTEIEWEYLARGGNLDGSQTMYSGGDVVGDVAWYSENSGVGGASYTLEGKPHLVMTKEQPNTLGLYDMSGNLWEVCWDWGGEGEWGSFTIYEITKSTALTGPSSGAKRMLRGGAWNYGSTGCEVSTRLVVNGPEERWENAGARIVRYR
ncbi:MAG: SUMF1/EgtB/PvdO family nonheme iron enzyme [Treponema sp.]|nr:SUMF1/EgtB/PvdO family nonheme iron enzyme [Treponema sp.]